MEQEDLEDYGYSYTLPAETSHVVLEPLYTPLGPAEPPAPQHEAQSQLTAAVAAVVMQHSLALASCIGSLVIVLATIALGWLLLWHTTLKDIGFFREIMGLNKPKLAKKKEQQAHVQAEIERIKRQHSRSASRSYSGARSGSLGHALSGANSAPPQS